MKLFNILFKEGKKTWYGAQNVYNPEWDKYDPEKDEPIEPRIAKDVPASFDINEFKKINKQEQRLKYLQETSMYIGAGSSRIVFGISPKKVIKLAGGSGIEQPLYSKEVKIKDIGRGINQNKVENDVWKQSSETMRMILPKVYEIGPTELQPLWLMSELVRPLGSDNELRSMLGVDQMGYADFMNGISDIDSDDFKAFYGRVDEKHKPIIDALVEMIKKFDLYSKDLTSIEQWGKSSDGRLVLLDSGITIKDFAEY